jgi:hypothetical protein
LGIEFLIEKLGGENKKLKNECVARAGEYIP